MQSLYASWLLYFQLTVIPAIIINIVKTNKQNTAVKWHLVFMVMTCSRLHLSNTAHESSLYQLRHHREHLHNLHAVLHFD